MVTHRLQDAFTMATHYYDSAAKEIRPLVGAHGEPKVNLETTFVILKDGKVIFDGSAPELARSSDEYIREYIA
jgi:phospholipid/cholesterol/gamma-HCH transport system ATP-binding protein